MYTLLKHVSEALTGIDRHAPMDLLIFPADSAEWFIDERSNVHLRHADLTWKRLEPVVRGQ